MRSTLNRITDINLYRELWHHRITFRAESRGIVSPLFVEKLWGLIVVRYFLFLQASSTHCCHTQLLLHTLFTELYYLLILIRFKKRIISIPFQLYFLYIRFLPQNSIFHKHFWNNIYLFDCAFRLCIVENLSNSVQKLDLKLNLLEKNCCLIHSSRNYNINRAATNLMCLIKYLAII